MIERSPVAHPSLALLRTVGTALYLGVILPSAGPTRRWYRVYDVAFGPPLAAPGRKRRVALGARHATHRWFVGADGEERCIDLRRDTGEGRGSDVDTLLAQFRGSAFLGRVAFDPASRTPETRPSGAPPAMDGDNDDEDRGERPVR